jgi:hypothetical protein
MDFGKALLEERRDGTARELARIGHVTRSGRPWTLWNVRAVYETAIRIWTISTE